MMGSRNGLSSEAAFFGLFLGAVENFFGRQGQEGHSALIEHPINGETQGIDISSLAIGLVIINLGSHISICTAYSATRGAFNGFGYAEVAQLVIPKGGYEDILGLNISMENIILVADHQSLTNILGKLDNHGLVRRETAIILLIENIGNRSEQLHLNENIPTNSVLMLNIANVVAVDYVDAAIELTHKRIFGDYVFEMALESEGNGLIIIAIIIHFLYIAGLLGYAYNFQRCFFNFAENIALNFIYAAKAATAYQSERFPAGPSWKIGHIRLPLVKISFLSSKYYLTDFADNNGGIVYAAPLQGFRKKFIGASAGIGALGNNCCDFPI